MALVYAAFVPSSLLIPYKSKAEKGGAWIQDIDFDAWHLKGSFHF